VKALEEAGYPVGHDNPLAKRLQKILLWVEEESKLKETHSDLTVLFNHEKADLTLIEFLVLLKLFSQGRRAGLDEVIHDLQRK